MKITYTVTTTTLSCPYCHNIIKEKKQGEWAPVLSIFIIFLLPIVILFFLIHLFAFKNPRLPKIGEKQMKCPHCALPFLTGKCAVEDLNAEELFIHKFKPWFYISYVMGGIWGVSCCFLLDNDSKLFSLCVFLAIASLIWIVITAFVYHIKRKRVRLENTMYGNTSFFYCHTCGTKLPSDSLFCNVCGTKVK